MTVKSCDARNKKKDMQKRGGILWGHFRDRIEKVKLEIPEIVEERRINVELSSLG